MDRQLEFDALLRPPPGTRTAGLRQLPPEQRMKLVAQLAELIARTVDPAEAATVDGAGSKTDPEAGEPRP